jgi:hypothetical protein
MESLIIAAQDQALSTCYHQQNIMKQPNGSKCRMRSKAEEQIKHIVVGCTTFAPPEYTNRHNKAAAYIHQTICEHTWLQFTDSCCEHIPETVIYINGATIMWDILVITDRKILANRPDIVLHDKTEKTCLLTI